MENDLESPSPMNSVCLKEENKDILRLTIITADSALAVIFVSLCSCYKKIHVYCSLAELQ